MFLQCNFFVCISVSFPNGNLNLEKRMELQFGEDGYTCKLVDHFRLCRLMDWLWWGWNLSNQFYSTENGSWKKLEASSRMFARFDFLQFWWEFCLQLCLPLVLLLSLKDARNNSKQSPILMRSIQIQMRHTVTAVRKECGSKIWRHSHQCTEWMTDFLFFIQLDGELYESFITINWISCEVKNICLQTNR